MNGNKPKERSPWLLACDDVISVLLQPERKSAYEYARFERGLCSWHFAPGEPHRALFDAVDDLYREGLPLHDTLILDRCRGTVGLDQYSQLFVLYDAIRGDRDRFRANVDLVVEKGVAFSNLQRIEETARDLRAGRTSAETITRLIEDLSSDSPDSTKEVTIIKALEFHEAYMASAENIRLIKTGIPWWDKHCGGIRGGLMYWIAAPYKMRKSSLARNILLGAVKNGASVSFGTLEGDQNRIVAELKVMLAIEWLLDHNLYHKTYQSNGQTRQMYEISAMGLLTIGNSYRQHWQPEQVAAIESATATLASYGDRLRIYDSTRRAGRLFDLNSVKRMIASDKAVYGCNLVILDYLQRIKAPGNGIYERVAELSAELQDQALLEEVGMVVLAQLNEDAIKSLGTNTWSTGVKGGGDPPATADYFTIVRYMIDDRGTLTDDSQHLLTMLKYTRHGGGGLATREALEIDPASGLLIPPTHQFQFNHPMHHSSAALAHL